jgi:hypothetical protein
MKNVYLANAKKIKNDEFYTQYDDVEKEISAYVDNNPDVFRNKVILLPCDDPESSNFTKYFTDNFAELGLKKLISTSYSFTGKGKIAVNGLDWEYLDGDGDFRSEEVSKLRDGADIIITNPPFSLFREFLTWAVDANKQFLLVGNINAITYKQVFPLIRDNKIWLGFTRGDKWYITPNGEKRRLGNICWFTNLAHGLRYRPLPLRTMAENLQHSKHAEIRQAGCYRAYDNYAAIEVPFTDAIPSDYSGVMGVPVSFLTKYCPEQFEILGTGEKNGKGLSNGLWDKSSKIQHAMVDGVQVYCRIFIRHR